MVDSEEDRTIDRSMAAIFLDLEMRKLMRALPIVDLLLGRALRSALTGRFEQAGYARPGDYCQQELGFTLRTAQLLMRSWQQMEAHPLVEQAFLEGWIDAAPRPSRRFRRPAPTPTTRVLPSFHFASLWPSSPRVTGAWCRFARLASTCTCITSSSARRG